MKLTKAIKKAQNRLYNRRAEFKRKKAAEAAALGEIKTAIYHNVRANVDAEKAAEYAD